MATLTAPAILTTPHFLPTKPPLLPFRSPNTQPSLISIKRKVPPPVSMAHKVTIEHEGETNTLEVDEDETILGRVLDEGVQAPHDCKLGVCMTCPAKLVSGEVDQSEGMLSDDVVEKGYALLCVSYPRSDCVFRTIPEEELLSLQLATADD